MDRALVAICLAELDALREHGRELATRYRDLAGRLPLLAPTVDEPVPTMAVARFADARRGCRVERLAPAGPAVDGLRRAVRGPGREPRVVRERPGAGVAGQP